MAVDRQQRDVAADALASFMRGEVDRKALHRRFETIRAGLSETAIRDRYLDYLLTWERHEAHHSLSKEDWNELRRDLAFLKTNLPDVNFPNRDERERRRQNRRRHNLLARWHLLALAIALGFSFFLGWWLVAVAFFLSSILYQISEWRHNAVQAGELERLMAFHPFASEEEWLAHEPLLEDFRLPAYVPGTHVEPVLKRILNAACLAVGFVIIGSVFAFMYAFCIVSWPLWLVHAAFSKRDRDFA